MAHHSKFLSVNLNKSYGKTSSSPSLNPNPSYGNDRPRSGGGGGGMVVLSRPRSSGGANVHKPAQRLAVPPPVNLPSLRKEHERLDPAFSKPSSGHGGSGLGPGNNSSMSWTKPTVPIADFSDKDGVSRSTVEKRSFGSGSLRQGSTEKNVILRGEDFPSLNATAMYFAKQKQKHVSEGSDGLADRYELRSSPPSKKNVQGSEGGSNRSLNSLESSRHGGGGNFTGPLPIMKLKHTSDWDDDERDRNHVDHYDGRVFPDIESHRSLPRDSGRGDPYGKDFTAFKKEDRNFSSWRVPVESNREFSSARAMHVDRDHFGHRNSALSRGTGKESSHDRLSYGDKKEIGNSGFTDGSNNLQRGKPFANSAITVKGFSTNDPVQNFTKEKSISNFGRSYAEDASWGEKDSFSSDSIIDLKAKMVRKKKETIKHTDIFDPARESFEAELVRVQQLQEQERQRLMEEQARIMEIARREAEERERIAREEEERRRLLEEEAREAAWRAEQEKLEAARRAEELRIARLEDKKRILMEEERRKEAARQKLLELEARIASRQTEANDNDRVKERNSSRDSDLAKCEKTETMVEHLTGSPSYDSSTMNRLSDAGFRPHTSNAENHSFGRHGKTENNGGSSGKFQDYDSGYLISRQDGFSSNRSLHRKQFQDIHGSKPVTASFKRGMSGDQAQTGRGWDQNRDFDQFNGSSSIDAIIGGWEHGHFDGNQLDSYSERSFQNSDVDDKASFSRVRHTIRQPRVPPPPSVSSSIHKNPRGSASVGLSSSLSVHVDAIMNHEGIEEESDVQNSYHQRIIEPGAETRMAELVEEPAYSLLQTEEKNSPRYDSQSSLSISNPPSSPTQLSHDEFDDCGGSPAITTSAEDENMTFSEAKSMMPELDAGKVDAEIIPFSHSNGEDDDWAIADNEKMLEEEDEQHDEGPDSNQEDNEARESDAWELQMKNKPDKFDVIIEKPREIVHAAYGIESRVQSGASDQYLLNKDSQYHEMAIQNEAHVFTDNSSGNLKSEETSHGKVLNASSEIVDETAEEQEDVLFGIVTNPDHPTDSIKATKNSSQNPIAAVSRLPLPSTSSLCSVSASVTTSSDQNDVPAKLQFGLFSSPPLIPSPLPTIQIGSIHMPIPLNAEIDSYNHMPHPPIFQFGRIVYSASTPKTVLPRAAHNLSYAHRLPPVHDQVNGNLGSSSKSQVSGDSTTTKGLDGGGPSSSADKQPVCASAITNPSRSNLDSEQATALLDVRRNGVLVSKQRMNSAVSDEKKDFHNLILHSGNPDAISNKNFRPMVYSRRARGRPHIDSFSSARKSFAGPTAPGIMSNIRGNRLTYNIRNTSSLSSFTRLETSYVNSDRSQRRFRRHVQGTEYRVKESGGRQMQCTESLNYGSNSVTPNSGNNVSKKGAVVNKSTKLMNEEAALYGSRVVRADNNMSRDNKKEALQTGTSSSNNFHGGDGNLNKNGLLEDDIDAPLLSGIVRVFNQPGIEASSDADGFVEVRSKRKISNERRGQRERETKLKHKATREPHRHRATLSNNGTGYKSDMVATLTGRAVAKSIHSDLAPAHKRPSTDPDAVKLTTASRTCQTIAAISSPDVNSTDYDSKFSSLKSSGAGSDIAIANDGPNVEPSLSFGNNIIALDKASVPLGSRGTIHMGQQAVTPTQSQLDENSNSVQCNPVGAAKVPLDDKKLPTTSMTKEKSSFSSENLPNFPFDGEKIQFGAVVSPPPLPPSGQPPSTAIWSPSSGILNASIIHNLPVNDHLDDTEAEAEAAASAVAVSVITNDEITASAKVASSIPGVGTIRLSRPRVTATGQSTVEEPLIVTLPADLSVDTPLSLWPPLPTVQSSRPMLSDIAGPHPSPFPFFDSNPMLGGPIFTYRPQDESAPAPQQQSPTFVSGPMGTWPPQCHSGVESSFYGSPAGFPGPFMSSPAGLSGVHGHPPPMVFYNHFAPMGQFGQLGLSYMGGGAYLPTGKQPDWKHCAEGNATVNGSKADPSSLNVVYGQQNGAQLPASIQHLSTGSGLLQVTSPFTLFNLPFQPSTEIPIPSQWPPIPHSHSANPLRPSTALPPELLQNPPRSAAAVNLPDELSLVESSSSIRSSSTTDIKIGSNCIIPDSETGKADNSRGSSSSSSSQGYGRRNIFHGKYGSNNKYNKNIGSSSKVKQIYVAKSVLTTTTTSGASSG